MQRRSAHPQLFYSDTSPESGGKIPESALLRVELNKIDSIGLGDPHAQQISHALENTPLPDSVSAHGSYPPPPPPHGGVPGGFGGFSAGFGSGGGGGHEGRAAHQGRLRQRRRRITDDRDAPADGGGGKAEDGRGRAIDNRRAATVQGRASFPSLIIQIKRPRPRLPAAKTWGPPDMMSTSEGEGVHGEAELVREVQ